MNASLLICFIYSAKMEEDGELLTSLAAQHDENGFGVITSLQFHLIMFDFVSMGTKPSRS